jgi:hypothetical protein
VFHPFEAEVYAERSSTIGAYESLDVTLLVVADAILFESAGLTKDASIYLDWLNGNILSDFHGAFWNTRRQKRAYILRHDKSSWGMCMSNRTLQGEHHISRDLIEN